MILAPADSQVNGNHRNSCDSASSLTLHAGGDAGRPSHGLSSPTPTDRMPTAGGQDRLIGGLRTESEGLAPSTARNHCRFRNEGRESETPINVDGIDGASPDQRTNNVRFPSRDTDTPN